MKILLFGKNGQVGLELMRTLLPHGRVIAMGREDLDLASATDIRTRLGAERPDIIVNAAAYTAVDKAESEEALAQAINADAVATLADYARESGALLVHYSTDYVFDGEKPSPYQTDDAANPQSAYGRTKLAGERAILDSGCRHLIFRTSWVFSAHGHNFVKTMLRLAAERDDLKVVSDQFGAPTSAELIADVTSLALLGHRHGLLPDGVYHLTASGQTSWHGLAVRAIDRAIANGAATRLKGSEVEAIPSDAYPTPAKRPANSCLDNQELASALGLELPDWTHHVDRVVDQLTSKSN